MSPGDTLRQLRLKKGMSQELLAEKSGISLRTIQRIEKGTSSPRPHTVKVLAEELGVTPDKLNPIHDFQQEVNEISILKRINFAALGVLILPITNIILPLWIWKKHKNHQLVEAIGKKIISIQILWTLVTALLLFFTPVVTHALTGSSSYGQFPVPLAVYLFLVTVNTVFIIFTAIKLGNNDTGFYTQIPSLF